MGDTTKDGPVATSALRKQLAYQNMSGNRVASRAAETELLGSLLLRSCLLEWTSVELAGWAAR